MSFVEIDIFASKVQVWLKNFMMERYTRNQTSSLIDVVRPFEGT